MITSEFLQMTAYNLVGAGNDAGLSLWNLLHLNLNRLRKSTY